MGWERVARLGHLYPKALGPSALPNVHLIPEVSLVLDQLQLVCT